MSDNKDNEIISTPGIVREKIEYFENYKHGRENLMDKIHSQYLESKKNDDEEFDKLLKELTDMQTEMSYEEFSKDSVTISPSSPSSSSPSSSMESSTDETTLSGYAFRDTSSNESYETIDSKSIKTNISTAAVHDSSIDSPTIDSPTESDGKQEDKKTSLHKKYIFKSINRRLERRPRPVPKINIDSIRRRAVVDESLIKELDNLINDGPLNISSTEIRVPIRSQYDDVIPSRFKKSDYTCRNCGLIFSSETIYNLHSCAYNRYGMPKRLIDFGDDAIPVDENGTCECFICFKKYADSYLLGEHFSIVHTQYTELCQLDKLFEHGFPGFKLLKHIKVVKSLTADEKQNVKDNKKTCDICCFEYYEEKQIRPVKIQCCNYYICRPCLRSHMSISDSVICPFCRHDHTVVDADYITIIEESDVTERDKWIPWWENHMEIFY